MYIEYTDIMNVCFVMLGAQFSELQLKDATENFSPNRLIGKGGFGSLYHGYMSCTHVAVKVLNEVYSYLNCLEQPEASIFL